MGSGWTMGLDHAVRVHAVACSSFVCKQTSLDVTTLFDLSRILALYLDCHAVVIDLMCRQSAIVLALRVWKIRVLRSRRIPPAFF